MDFSALPASLRELRDKARVWAQDNGFAGYAGYMGARGKGDEEDQEPAHSWQREAFSSRIDMVGLNLNLPVRPVLLAGDAMEDAKEVLREAYRCKFSKAFCIDFCMVNARKCTLTFENWYGSNEPLFRWLLGDVRKDNKGKAKENILLEWLIDWRVSSCLRYSHTLAIPRPPRQGQSTTFGESGEQEVDVRGCAIVTYPGRCRLRKSISCALCADAVRSRNICCALAHTYRNTQTQTHAHTHAYTHTHTHTHPPTHPLTHPLTHTYTHIHTLTHTASRT